MAEKNDVLEYENAEVLKPASEVDSSENLPGKQDSYLPLVLCIGRKVLQLHPLQQLGASHDLYIVYAQDIYSAERILQRETVDVVTINLDSIEANIHCLQHFHKLGRLRKIPVFAFQDHEQSTDQARLLKAGFMDCFNASTAEEILKQKILRVSEFRRSCLSDHREITSLRSRTKKLNEILEQNKTYLEDLNATLEFEKLKRKELEQVHYIVNRSLVTMCAGIHALVSARSEPELTQSMCDVLIKHKHYAQVWVGYIKGDSDKLDIVANATFDQRESRISDLNCINKSFGCTSIAQAIATDTTVVNSNIPYKSSCQSCWRSASENDYNSTVTLPLNVGGDVIGVLNIDAKLGVSIDHDEMEMLRDVSADLAYGISALRSRAERDRLHFELNTANSELEKKIDERTQTLREANEKLKELDRLKSLFIASMSHELRTPLNSIIGFTGIVLQGLSGEINEKQSEQLQRVYNSAKHLLELIVNVIDIAKIEGHRLEINTSEFGLGDVLDAVVDEFSTSAQQKGLEFIVDRDYGVVLNTDRERLFQCLRHVVSNAIKYTEKGSITIRVTESEGNVNIAVSDTGIGIKKDQMRYCFQAFERLSSHLRVQAGGAGLGLYLTKKLIVDLLQGSIDVESEPGRGSIFRLNVPKEPLRDS